MTRQISELRRRAGWLTMAALVARPHPDPMLRLRRALLLIFLVALAGGFGCAGTETREYARELDPLVGRAPLPYFIERYGEPERRVTIDRQTEVLEFRVAEDAYSGRSARGSVAVVTQLRLTFKDGILSAWQAFTAVR